ncbi:Bug family tripartite tricarboxylate transporter substrate binding protein [Falsirhodobacter xinxiangensis]|uniref:Bug family tripartite tricarboxylate transporter substrate binding protein n=1 Tax=Falsirhodobacter xinxiangensis TaxID=2530049 RepID=UPI0010A9A4A8|nr:tripartite tricarboxylate transporter substrate-binding protein [Rhodobacter xinxiangensis]
MFRPAIALVALASGIGPVMAWEPTRPIEIVVPFSPGGASDQMARTIQGIIQKNSFTKAPIVVVNKPAAAGAEAMMDIKSSAGDPQKLLTTSTGVFLTPMTTKLDLAWTDYTPVAMLAEDAFALWVNAGAPYQSAQDFVEAAKASGAPLKVGGTGSKREDQLIALGVNKAAGINTIYIPHTGGGQASTQLAGQHLDATTNNPAEEVANWRGGATRPLCVFSAEALPYTEKVTEDESWHDIPTCASQGLDVQYQMLRGIFLPGGVTPEQQAYYVDLFTKVSETDEWKEYLERSALLPEFRAGEDFVTYLQGEEEKHRAMLSDAGFLVQ